MTDDEVVTLRMSGYEPSGQRAAWRQVTLPVDNGGSLTRHVRSRGETLVVEDFRNLPRDLYDPDLAKEGVASALVVPLKRSSIDYGTLGIYDNWPRKFSAEEIQFMETARNLLMIAVERSSLEHNLCIADRFRESILQSMQTFYVLVRADGQIVDMNRAMQDACGFRLDEIQGRSFVGLFALDREAECIAAVLKTIAADPVHLICRLPTKHGEIRRVAWMFAMASAPKEHRQYIATGTDITEQAVALERAEHAQCEVQKLRESLMALRSAIDAGDIVQVRRVVVDMEERSKDDRGAGQPGNSKTNVARRSHVRRPAGQLISVAPALDGKIPAPDEFVGATCLDLSVAGISFLLPTAPLAREYFVVLGSGKNVLQLRTEVRNSQYIRHDGEFVYRVGCRFTERLRQVPNRC
jgi:PAS domain S-box-containing protein